MKGIIGIASVQDGIEERLQLPKVKIYVTQSGEYLFLDKTVIEEAISLSLKNAEANERSALSWHCAIACISSNRSLAHISKKPKERRNCTLKSCFKHSTKIGDCS